MPLKDQFGQKLARDVLYYHNRIIQRYEKNGYSRQSCRLPDSPIWGVVFRIEYLREFEAKIGTARNVV
jgi:hypothetical protein